MNGFALTVRVGAALRSRLRNLWFRALGVDIAGYAWLRRVSIPRQWADISLEVGVALDDGVVLLCSGVRRGRKLTIGSGTYVNRYTIVDAHAGIAIGRDCLIGPHCYITDANHGTFAAVAVKAQSMDAKPVVIEDEVWLGAGVIVLPGVRIGRGAVVGAGTVVTRDVADRTIVVGVPGRPLGRRTEGL